MFVFHVRQETLVTSIIKKAAKEEVRCDEGVFGSDTRRTFTQEEVKSSMSCQL